MRRRVGSTFAGLVLSFVLLGTGVGAAATSRSTDFPPSTSLPFTNASLAVDPAGQHVFAAGGPGNSSVVVLDYDGNIVTTITGEQGASGMTLDMATHTLYVALADANAISEIDTQMLTETARFSTGAFTAPYKPAIAGGKLWIGTDGGLATANLDGTGLAGAALPTGAGLPDFSGGADTPTASADGHLLAVVRNLSQIGVFDVTTSSPSLVSLNRDANWDSAGTRNLLFDPSGQNVLLAAGVPYHIESADTRTMQESGEYTAAPYPDAVAMSPGGKYVAGGVISPYSPNLYLYRTGDQTAIQSWQLPYAPPSPYGPPSTLVFWRLAFSPDGTRLFAVAGGKFFVFSTPDGPDKAVSITSAPDDKTSATDASFAFSSPDNSVTFQCSLDGAPSQPCTSPASYSDLSGGLHTFQVQAVDASGIEGSTGQTWMVEALDTKLWASSLRPSPTYETNASFAFASHDENATFECNLDSADWTPCTSPAAYTQLAPGPHSFAVRAVEGDQVDETSGASKTWTVKPPDTVVTKSPHQGSYINTATFSFTSDAGFAQPLTYQCALDGSDWASCSSPITYTGLALGSHTFHVRTVNNAGAVDPVGKTWIWTIIPPDSFFSSTPANPTLSSASSFFRFFSDYDPATFQCSLDGGDWAPCTSPSTFAGLALGTHTFGVRSVSPLAVDPVGAAYTWTINQNPADPGVSIDNGQYATNTTNVQLKVAWPALAQHVLISNSSSFGATTSVPVATAIPWTLPSSGGARSTVYLRFADSSTPTATVLDSIVLDKTTPIIQTARVTKAIPTTRTYTVQIHATESVSGVSQVALSATKSGGTIVVLRSLTQPGFTTLAQTITRKLPARPKWVRVRSAAGTWSTWHAVG